MYVSLQEYLRPGTVGECLGLLGGETTALLAGGTHLNARGHADVVRLVDVQALPLGGLAVEGGALRLGANVRLAELGASALPVGVAALAEAAAGERNQAVRNQSTVGGRLGRDRSDGRLATALVALGAEVEVLALGAGGEERAVMPLATFLARAPELRRAELIAAVRVPSGVEHSAYASFAPSAMEAPLADAAICGEGARCQLATGGHAAGARGTLALPRTSAVASSIERGASESVWRGALEDAARQEIPAYTDARAGGAYRRDVAITLLRRLVSGWLCRRGDA